MNGFRGCGQKAVFQILLDQDIPEKVIHGGLGFGESVYANDLDRRNQEPTGRRDPGPGGF